MLPWINLSGQRLVEFLVKVDKRLLINVINECIKSGDES
jgi:hypothetical protein